MYMNGTRQDTIKIQSGYITIHHDTSGYVSDRKLHPKTIGNPPSPPTTLAAASVSTAVTAPFASSLLAANAERDVATRQPCPAAV